MQTTEILLIGGPFDDVTVSNEGPLPEAMPVTESFFGEYGAVAEAMAGTYLPAGITDGGRFAFFWFKTPNA